MKQMTDKIKTTDRYNWYKETYDNPVSQTLYNIICWELNQAVLDYLLEGNGNSFYFNSRLGYLTIYKFHRKIRIKDGKLIAPPDWGKTNKLRAEGKLDKGKVVYITDTYYVGFKWVKEHCNVSGQHAYKFKSSRTNGYDSVSGANNKLREKLKDPLYHFKFPFIDEK
jgi:hypothetical protein